MNYEDMTDEELWATYYRMLYELQSDYGAVVQLKDERDKTQRATAAGLANVASVLAQRGYMQDGLAR